MKADEDFRNDESLLWTYRYLFSGPAWASMAWTLWIIANADAVAAMLRAVRAWAMCQHYALPRLREIRPGNGTKVKAIGWDESELEAELGDVIHDLTLEMLRPCPWHG